MAQRPAPGPKVLPRPHQRGLALLDVLIGMALFGLIVVVAILSSGHLRERAWETAASADADRLGTALQEAVLAAPLGGGFLAFTSTSGVLLGSGSALWTDDTDPLDATGIELYDGNRLVDWDVHEGTGGSFYFCVEHVFRGEPGAWARYHASDGGVTGKGRHGGCPEYVPPTGPGSSPPGGGGAGGTTDPVTAPPGGGGGGGPADGDEDEPPPVVPVPSNDDCENAAKLPQPSNSDGVSSVNSSNRASADGSVWFHTYAPIMGYLTYGLESPAGTRLDGNRAMTVYRGPQSYNDDQTCVPDSLTELVTVDGPNPGYSFRSGIGNQNYYIRVSSSAFSQSDFRIRLYMHRNEVVRDQFERAEPIDAGQNQTRDFNHSLSTNLWATGESGEGLSVGAGSIWYRLHNYWSPSPPTYTVRTLPPTGGEKPIGAHQIEIYSGASGAGSRGTLVTSAYGQGSAEVTFTGPPSGGHFHVRIVGESGREGGYYRLQLTRGAN